MIVLVLVMALSRIRDDCHTVHQQSLWCSSLDSLASINLNSRAMSMLVSFLLVLVTIIPSAYQSYNIVSNTIISHCV